MNLSFPGGSVPVVAVVNVGKPSLEGVREAVESAVAASGFSRNMSGHHVLVKINGVSAFITPGASTSPWMLDAVLHWLRRVFPDARITVADSDSSARRHFTRAARLWGYDRIAARYGAEIVNMCDLPWDEIPSSIPGYPTVRVSRLALECDSLINVPVLKTHTWSGASCAMKNLYGLYDNNRHSYHLSLTQAILGLVKQFPVALTITDATVGLEGGGPVMGYPVEAGLVLASTDIVASDAAAFDLIGLGRARIEHCATALEQGGYPDPPYTIKGESRFPRPFHPARQNFNSRAHWFIRHSKALRGLLEWPATFRMLSLASTWYQIYWYSTHARSSRRTIIKDSPYGQQYGPEGSIYFSWLRKRA